MIHPSAEVSSNAIVGTGTRIWHQAQVRERARIGRNCVVGKGAYVDVGVSIGDNVKIENYASVFHGAIVEDGVLLGPYSCLANDKLPRAITSSGALKGERDWEAGHVVVRYGAAIGAGAIVLPGVTIGRWALVGAGAVVTRDVPDHGLALGVPARIVGFVCRCGHRLTELRESGSVSLVCSRCNDRYDDLIPAARSVGGTD